MAGGSVPSTTCRVDSIEQTGTSGHFQARGCGRGWRSTGNQSRDEWAQYWGAVGVRVDTQPVQQGWAIDRHRECLGGGHRGRIAPPVTKAGMRGTMNHRQADVLKQLGVSAF